MNPLQFDPDKALEVLVYTAARMPQGNLYKTLKAIYEADKRHLERYGRFIYGEKYVAMNLGPVPSQAYDLTKVARGAREQCAINAEDVRRSFSVSNNGESIKTQRDPQIHVLSQSEMECLDEAVRVIAPLSFGAVKHLTHDAAYKKVAPKGTTSSIEMPIECILEALPKEARKAVKAHLADPFPG